MVTLNPFRRGTTKKEITQATVIGDVMLADGEQIPMAMRSTLQREFTALQRGASGVSDSGLSQAVKLSVPAYACIRYYATSAKSIPLAIETSVITNAHPFNVFMMQKSSIIELSVTSLLIWGKVYLRKLWNDRDELGNPAGYPTKLEFINPNNIRQEIDRQTGEIVGYELTQTKEKLRPEDVIYIPSFDPSGDGNPLSPLENCFAHLGVEQGIANYAISFFFNKALPTGIVKFNPPLLQHEFDRFKKSWKQQFKGAGNAHKTAFLNGAGEFQSIQDPPKDLAMSELTDNSKQMVAAAFNVPPDLVGLADTSSSSLSQEQITATRRAFLEASVIPTVQHILQHLNEYWLHVNFSPPRFYSLVTNEATMRIFSEITSDRVQMTINLVQSGAINYEQQLEMLGLNNPVGDEDTIYLTAPPDFAMTLYKVGMISLNTAYAMIGLEPIAFDRWKIDGKTIPAHEVNEFITQQSAPPLEDNEQLLLSEPESNIDDSVFNTITLPPLQTQPSRNTITGALAVDFSKHNFVKTAQRKLSKTLAALDVDNIAWIKEHDWRLHLIDFDGCTHSHVARMMRELDLGNKMRVEVFSRGYRIHGNSIYWSIDINKDLSLLRSSLNLEISDKFQLSGNNSTIIGIKLCDCDASNINDDMLSEDVIDAPLVVDNVSIYVDGDIRHTWRIQRVTEAQRTELNQWRNKYRTHTRRGVSIADVEFIPNELPQHVVDYVIDEVGKEGANINAIFAEARTRLQNRAIQATLIDFELFLEDAIAEARAGNTPRARFTTILRNAINRFGSLAYRDGLVDGGVLDGVLDEDDRSIADGMIKDNQSFAKRLSARIYSADGISDEEAASRPGIWSKNVVMSLYNAGRVSADKNGMYEFVRTSPTNDKCPDCVRLEGQVHRLKGWASRNLIVPNPGKQKTECEGWQCGHTLVPTTARARGRF